MQHSNNADYKQSNKIGEPNDKASKTEMLGENAISAASTSNTSNKDNAMPRPPIVHDKLDNSHATCKDSSEKKGKKGKHFKVKKSGRTIQNGDKITIMPSSKTYKDNVSPEGEHASDCSVQPKEGTAKFVRYNNKEEFQSANSNATNGEHCNLNVPDNYSDT